MALHADFPFGSRISLKFLTRFVWPHAGSSRSAMNVCYSLRSPKTKVLGLARDSQAKSLDADTGSGSVPKLTDY